MNGQRIRGHHEYADEARRCPQLREHMSAILPWELPVLPTPEGLSGISATVPRKSLKFDLTRLETFPIPEDAPHEAVLNALIKKDYGSGTPIRIHTQQDRLPIRNSGPLPLSWTARTLLEPHNPDIASTLFWAGLIEAWGHGYERIVDACREAGTPEPAVEYDGNGVWLKWGWVNPGSDAGTAEAATPPVTDPVDRLLVALEHGARGSIELRAHLGHRDRTHLRERYINPALAEVLVEMTTPDKPNSRLQKYRLTKVGRSRLAARVVRFK